MKRYLKDPALLIQVAKVLVLSLGLGVFLVFPKADAVRRPALPGLEAPAPAPPAPTLAKAEKKKKNRAKKPEPRPLNVLTREEGRRLIHYGFEIPPALRIAVNFWKAAYSQY